MRPTTSSAWAPTALRANSAASARRVATRSPCASIASTTESCEVWMRSIRLSPRSPRRDSRLSPTALRRLSTSLTRAGAGIVGIFLASLSEALAQIAASDDEVLRDAVVRCCYGVTNACSAGHDRLALIGHFGDEQADFALVVGIGALKRRHLRSYARLELRGARQSAFDPIAHRREFATDGLGHVRDMIAGHGLRIGQTHSDLGDRARGWSQLEQPPR